MLSDKAKKLGNESAYPRLLPPQGQWTEYEFGLTKREEFAKAAMQGMCGNEGEYANASYERAAERSVTQADALLEALAKEEV